jgi:ABC-type nitrate/sulfonate/bicarbonate transport system substrate-binding protein
MPADAAGGRRPGARRGRPRGRLLVALALLLLGPPASAADGKTVKVGVLKLSSSAPIFLGVERGTFK